MSTVKDSSQPRPTGNNPEQRPRWRQRSQYGFLIKRRLQNAADSIDGDPVPARQEPPAQTGRSQRGKDTVNRQGRRSLALLGSVAIALSASQAHAANVFINEFHYDNAGVDVNEGVEIAGPAGLSLDGWQLQLYNGGNGEVYRTLNLASSFTDSYNGYGIIHVVTGSLQNGPADGFALLSLDGDVYQFISYEGQVTAVDGGAAGMTSTDIGIAEDSEAPEGLSLQLTGIGAQYSDFSWTTAFNSLGIANVGQVFQGPSPNPVPLPAAAWLFGAALCSLGGLASKRARPG